MMIPSIASAKQGFKTHPKVYLPDNPSRSSGRRLVLIMIMLMMMLMMMTMVMNMMITVMIMMMMMMLIVRGCPGALTEVLC